ncbi:unnamed protein product [Cyclocybe aegerita]|uniref:Uncharacterized protein n=1 Tax=Cyclocybe aegerita TaxID=1973307 RepID=A0A8S0VTT6_CYCAE|nr:unnamed protein product [Cyclocybe aegerita]
MAPNCKAQGRSCSFLPHCPPGSPHHHSLALLSLCCHVSPIEHPQGLSNNAPGSFGLVLAPLPSLFTPPPVCPPCPPLPLLTIQHPQGLSNNAPGAQMSLNFRVRARSGSFFCCCLPGSPHPLTLLTLLALHCHILPSDTPRGRPTTPLVHEQPRTVTFGVVRAHSRPTACLVHPTTTHSPSSPSATASHHLTPPEAIQRRPWCTNKLELQSSGLFVCVLTPPPAWFTPPPHPPCPPPLHLTIQHPSPI